MVADEKKQASLEERITALEEENKKLTQVLTILKEDKGERISISSDSLYRQNLKEAVALGHNIIKEILSTPQTKEETWLKKAEGVMAINKAIESYRGTMLNVELEEKMDFEKSPRK